MKLQFFTAGISAAAVLFLAACGTTTILNDPSNQTAVRDELTVSQEEMRQVAREAVSSAMTNAKFQAFLRKYKKEMKDQDAIPILKLDKTKNDTDDPDLNVDSITDILNEELINAGKVDVTMAEGAGRTQAIVNSRKMEDDDNFDQKTVAKRGTLQAARLLLRPRIISNQVRDGDKTVVARFFVMEMADIQTGLIMWKFSRQLGFMKERGTVGW